MIRYGDSETSSKNKGVYVVSNTDYRISTSFFSNPKIIRLERRHSKEAILCLIKLWNFAALHRPSGILYDMTKDDICAAAGWQGSEDFINTLIELKLLDVNGDILEIHDWHKYNNWAMGAEIRSEKARKAALTRWGMQQNNK